jgi:hypothetical protein
MGAAGFGGWWHGRGGGDGESSNPLMLFWKGYNEMLKSSPIVTKVSMRSARSTSLVRF